MKVIIVSDLHGSVFYLKRILKIIEENGIEKVILLGDYFSYLGDENEELLNLLNSLSDKVIAIRGNSDYGEVSKLLNFELRLYYLLEIDQLSLFLTHGHKNYGHFMDENMILVSGHTHIYALNKDYINPGSITYPKGSKEHTYIIYEDFKFSLYDINEKRKIKELVIERK